MRRRPFILTSLAAVGSLWLPAPALAAPLTPRETPWNPLGDDPPPVYDGYEMHKGCGHMLCPVILQIETAVATLREHGPCAHTLYLRRMGPNLVSRSYLMILDCYEWHANQPIPGNWRLGMDIVFPEEQFEDHRSMLVQHTRNGPWPIPVFD